MSVLPGTFRGGVEISGRYPEGLVLRSERNYGAILEHSSTVIDLDGVLNVTIQGFELRHDGPGAEGFVVSVDRGPENTWSESVVLANNIIHDSYSNDLLKIHAGVRYALVTGNVFYNQGDSEQHIDVNSVEDVVIQDNIFFNDFGRSERDNEPTRHFIVVKDSGHADDGAQGSRRIAIRRNVFMNWQGRREAMIRVGNDGKPYFEAVDVQIESNLFLANSQFFDAPVGVSGAKRVAFVNNTVVGDLDIRAFGFRAQAKGDNPKNEDLVFANNIWSDPTGGMSRFTSGNAGDTVNLMLDSNLFWNDDQPIPGGRAASPSDDQRREISDPGLGDPRDARPPIWNGRGFESGGESIRSEFVRLVTSHGAISESSAAVDTANRRCAAQTDILDRSRGTSPDIGAWEVTAGASRSHVSTVPSSHSVRAIVSSVRFGCGHVVPSDLFSFCDPLSVLHHGGVLDRCVM